MDVSLSGIGKANEQVIHSAHQTGDYEDSCMSFPYALLQYVLYISLSYINKYMFCVTEDKSDQHYISNYTMHN